MTTPTMIRSQQVLERTPNRALTFLRGAQFKPIRAALQRAGFRKKDHDEGWKLVMRACGFDMTVSNEAMPDQVADAIKELDAWDEGGFRRARAALQRLHPEQCELVFAGLAASQGMQAVVGIITFLDRLDALESSPDRKATRKADQAALDTLEVRGLGVEERKRLRKLVKIVQSSPDLLLEESDEAEARAEVDRIEALNALRAWFEDWTDTARAVVTRRDYLIRLGLAKRKGNKIEDVGDDDTDDPTPDPAPAPIA